MGSNVTSTTISFVSQTIGADSGSIAIELDAVKNNNKTQFPSGDTVFFKVYTSPLTMLIDSDSSSGSVTIGETKNGDITETIIFANEKEANLSYIGNSISSFKWFGRNLGSPVLNGSQITIAAAGVGVLEITYNASHRNGNLSGVTIPTGLTEFPVVVVISERAAA